VGIQFKDARDEGLPGHRSEEPLKLSVLRLHESADGSVSVEKRAVEVEEDGFGQLSYRRVSLLFRFQSSIVIAHRSWSRQRPAILR